MAHDKEKKKAVNGNQLHNDQDGNRIHTQGHLQDL